MLRVVRYIQPPIGDDRNLGRIPASQFNQTCISFDECRFPCLKLRHMDKVHTSVLQRAENDLGGSFAFCPLMFIVVHLALRDAHTHRSERADSGLDCLDDFQCQSNPCLYISAPAIVSLIGVVSQELV
ncbi:hypothetical protein D3C72_1560410 [compost metagenome]